MTRLTALAIKSDPEIWAGSIKYEDGRFGIYVGTYTTSPSGSKRPRTLLTGPPKYSTSLEACEAAEALIADVRGEADKRIEEWPAGRKEERTGA
jgi:hypothetical protein